MIKTLEMLDILFKMYVPYYWALSVQVEGIGSCRVQVLRLHTVLQYGGTSRCHYHIYLTEPLQDLS